MTEVNGSSHAGSQPASGGHGSNGSMTGGFELISGSIMGIGGAAGVSPPVSTVGITSMMDITLEQALIRMQDLARENAELRGEFVRKIQSLSFIYFGIFYTRKCSYTFPLLNCLYKSFVI